MGGWEGRGGVGPGGVGVGWVGHLQKKTGVRCAGRQREREDGEELKAARRWDAGVNDGCLSCRRDEQLTAS